MVLFKHSAAHLIIGLISLPVVRLPHVRLQAEWIRCAPELDTPLHSVDIDAAGLADYGKLGIYFERQLGVLLGLLLLPSCSHCPMVLPSAPLKATHLTKKPLAPAPWLGHWPHGHWK
jgi:hypothetical protein